jgi:N-acetylglucosaminyl-diphospho-decaprenol L-rhamnosyltransferase
VNNANLPRQDYAARIERQVVVVIVNYRTCALVCRSLGALATERELLLENGIGLRVVVVDNDSGDFPALQKYVEQQGQTEWVSVILAERNGGFAYGNNRGIEHAYTTGTSPDYFYLLNPDAEVRPAAILNLIDFMDKSPGAGMAGGSFEESDGAPWLRAFRFPSILGEINHGLGLGLATRLLDKYVVARVMGQQAQAVDWICGAAMLLRREVIEQLGGMDESYFLYFEETDFCWKMRKAGWSVWYVPQSRVMHHMGASTGFGRPGSQPKRLPSYWFESRRRYFAKNYGIRYAVATDTVFLVAHMGGLLKSWLKGHMHQRTPHFTSDFLRASVLFLRNRAVAAPQEFRPPRVQSRGDQT